jgi:hypothetical protein
MHQELSDAVVVWSVGHASYYQQALRHGQAGTWATVVPESLRIAGRGCDVVSGADIPLRLVALASPGADLFDAEPHAGGGHAEGKELSNVGRDEDFIQKFAHKWENAHDTGER